MFEFFLLFNDRSETQGAGFIDADVTKVLDLYVVRAESDDVDLPRSITGWCVAAALVKDSMFDLTIYNPGANTRDEMGDTVVKARSLDLHTMVL